MTHWIEIPNHADVSHLVRYHDITHIVGDRNGSVVTVHDYGAINTPLHFDVFTNLFRELHNLCPELPGQPDRHTEPWVELTRVDFPDVTVRIRRDHITHINPGYRANTTLDRGTTIIHVTGGQTIEVAGDLDTITRSIT